MYISQQVSNPRGPGTALHYSPLSHHSSASAVNAVFLTVSLTVPLSPPCPPVKPLPESPPMLPTTTTPHHPRPPAGHPLLLPHCLTFGTAALTQSRCRATLSRGEAQSWRNSTYYKNQCPAASDLHVMPFYYTVTQSVREEGKHQWAEVEKPTKHIWMNHKISWVLQQTKGMLLCKYACKFSTGWGCLPRTDSYPKVLWSRG